MYDTIRQSERSRKRSEAGRKSCDDERSGELESEQTTGPKQSVERQVDLILRYKTVLGPVCEFKKKLY